MFLSEWGLLMSAGPPAIFCVLCLHICWPLREAHGAVGSSRFGVLINEFGLSGLFLHTTCVYLLLIDTFLNSPFPHL